MNKVLYTHIYYGKQYIIITVIHILSFEHSEKSKLYILQQCIICLNYLLFLDTSLKSQAQQDIIVIIMNKLLYTHIYYSKLYIIITIIHILSFERSEKSIIIYIAIVYNIFKLFVLDTSPKPQYDLFTFIIFIIILHTLNKIIFIV